MSRIIIVPGWRDSGPGHWQSLWAQQLPNTVRVQQDDWINPRRSAWVDRISQTILAQEDQVVVVAHSLGCIAVSHLPEEATARIASALLVSPADPERKAVLADFAPVPYQRLSYHSIVVASNDDPYCPVRTAAAYARAWGSELVKLQHAGHINVESGHGFWPLGLGLLQSLLSPSEQSEGDVKQNPLAYSKSAQSGFTLNQFSY
jgi:predicted alpha/beta hydrolase family esterase